MSQNLRTKSEIVKEIRDELDEYTPEATLDLIAAQIMRADEAAERINREGSVVRDMKGSVVPHPAIKIEQDATKLATDIMYKNK